MTYYGIVDKIGESGVFCSASLLLKVLKKLYGEDGNVPEIVPKYARELCEIVGVSSRGRTTILRIFGIYI
jgi:hypothetical protein